MKKKQTQQKLYINVKDFVCHKCKTQLYCVCCRSIISVHENGFEFECFTCLFKDATKDYEKEEYAKKTLAMVLTNVLQNH